MRAGQSGIIYDFFLYGGKNSTGGNSCIADAIVLKLSEGIPRNQGFRLFFDNWFSALDLMVQLKSIGILSTTFRTNRLKGCPVASDKELKKEGRRSYDYLRNYIGIMCRCNCLLCCFCCKYMLL